ncbi:hypothetical protein ABK040_005235 [Willaertia magna]
MFLIDWLWTVLEWTGILNKIKGKIIFVGLDNAGKTTLLYKLTSNLLTQPVPTQYPNCETIQLNSSCTIRATDVGGHPLVRGIWKNYFIDIDGLVFIVDANDKKRLTEASNELQKILKDNDLENIPVLVIGNKVDIPTALSEEELAYSLGIQGLRTGKTAGLATNNRRPLELFMSSVVNHFNITESFEWLASYMK